MKHIKLWKITDREPFHFVNWNINRQETHAIDDMGIPISIPKLNAKKNIINELKVPKYIRDERCVITGLKSWFPYEGHIPPITHLSVTADKENFISSDYFKLNLWDFFRIDTCFTIADFFPTNTQLREVITTIDTHPLYSNLFVHGSNLGNINLCDLRERSLAQKPSKQFSSIRKDRKAATVADAFNDEDQQSLFDEVTSGVAGVKFSRGGKYIVSRDYMSVKIWDTRYEKRPFETFYVHEYLREGLFELYKAEQLGDAFGLGLSSKGNIVTGTYNNYFHLFELSERKDVFIQASREPETISPIQQLNKRRDVSYHNPRRNNNKRRKMFGMFGSTKKLAPVVEEPTKRDDYPIKMDFQDIDFEKKVLDCAWNPSTEAVAITAQNSLFVYSK